MATKKLTPAQKAELLEIDQETLSISKISKLFGKTTSKVNGKFVINEPKFDVRSELKLEAGEYINKEAVDTTVGIFLFNKIMVEGMIEELIPNGFYNEVINKSGFNKLIDIVSNGLMMGKIKVNPTLVKWLKQYEFYGMKACTIFSPSYSYGLLKQNAQVQKEKAKLLKDQDNKTVTEMTEIEDALVSSSRKILKDDPGMTLFDSGARGSFDNDYKNMNLMIGPVPKPGNPGEFDMATGNYIEGMNKEDIVAYGNIAVNAVYPKAIGTQDSGYLTKQYYAAYQSIQCDEDGTDCKTSMGLKVKLTPSNAEDYYFQNIQTNKGYEVLTSENKDKFIGKEVVIRSPMFCKSDKICSVCAGRRFYLLGIKNIGLTTGRITNTLLNASMKNFHNAKLKYDTVNENNLLF